MTQPKVLWQPCAEAWTSSRMGQFAHTHRPEAVGDYKALWQWSVDDLPGFWSAVWSFFAVESTSTPTSTLADPSMPGAVWFPGARLNWAAHMLRGNGLEGVDVAVLSTSQTRSASAETLASLRERVRLVAAGLRRLGVREGDRVAAYMPNIPETLIGFLATASLGAVWCSCAPEFGTRAVVDRWGQVSPTVLLTIDGYRHGEREVSRHTDVEIIRSALPSLRHTVLLPYLDPDADGEGLLPWTELEAPTTEPLTFAQVPFDHPLCILYSSGTTGLPKPIVHGHGGILLEHLKSLGLHLDLGSADRFFWFSTTGWMMWNYVISGLLVGAPIILFDGNPGHPDLDTLWAMAANTGASYVGLSASFIMSCRKAGLRPNESHDLDAVRGVGSTGSPLPVEGFQWIRDAVGPRVQVGSASGGTDVCTAFVGAAPVLPVAAGRIPGRALGCRVEAWDESGRPLTTERGELVVTAPMPSMPVGFFGDHDGSRYRQAYFDTFPGVWRHGDWITIFDDGSCAIDGRSDATLNRGGVRLGTSELYAVVEAMPEIVSSLVVHLESPEGDKGELLLFVEPAPGTKLDEPLRVTIRTALRDNLSPRHVPDEIIAVPRIPTTLSGKKVEVPVKRILTGTPVDEAISPGALSEPAALDAFRDLAIVRAST